MTLILRTLFNSRGTIPDKTLRIKEPIGEKWFRRFGYIWKVGLAGKNAQQPVVKGLEKQYKEWVKEKNGALILYDIIMDMLNLYDVTISSKIKKKRHWN